MPYSHGLAKATTERYSKNGNLTEEEEDKADEDNYEEEGEAAVKTSLAPLDWKYSRLRENNIDKRYFKFENLNVKFLNIDKKYIKIRNWKK